MYCTDLAFVYKEKTNLLCAITKNNKKIMLKNIFFYSMYFPLETFYFVEYEYVSDYSDSFDLNKKNILKANRIYLYYIISLVTIEKDISFLSDVLTYVISDYIDTENLFLFLYTFFIKKKMIGIVSREEKYFFFLRELFFYSHVISLTEYSSLETFNDTFLLLSGFLPKELYRKHYASFFT